MERGRSLSELGRTLTWVDLRAFVKYLPPSSHFRQAEHPDLARQLHWAQRLAEPDVVLLGDIYDLLEAQMYLRAGQSPPETTSLQRFAQRLMTAGQDQQGSSGGGAQAGSVQRKRLSADQIRAKLNLEKPQN